MAKLDVKEEELNNINKILNDVYDNKFEFVEKYSDKRRSFYNLKCKKCGSIFSCRTDGVKNGLAWCKCTRRTRKCKHTIKSLNEFSKKELNGKYTVLELYPQVTDTHWIRYVKIKCNDCGNTIDTSVSQFINKQVLCRICYLNDRREEFKKWLKENRDDLICLNIEEYENENKKLLFQCLECGYIWEVAPGHIKNGTGCPDCGGTRKYTPEEIVEMARIVHGDYYDYDLDSIKGMHKLMRIKCPIHGWFEQTPISHINKGCNCPKCAHQSYPYTPEEIVEMARKIHGNTYEYDLDSIKGMKEPMRIKCPIHGWFEQTPTIHIYHKCGCQKCKASHLEEELIVLFEEKGIKYKFRDRPKFLDGQEIDLHLEDLKIGIECQGGQHFEPKEFFGGEERYIHQLELDAVKFDKCKENGITLLYFTHETPPKDYLGTIYLNKYDLLKTILEYANKQ